jgi:GNAT superfamily N-acetyltransferase/SAM-dependent methyltransferase
MPPAHELVIEPSSLDSADARALIGELNRQLDDDYPEPGANHFRLDAGEVAPGRGVFLIARLGGEAVGCGAVRALDDGVAEIKRMYTRPAARGKGVARALLAALEVQARSLGATRLVLETGERQRAAVALYVRAGFEEIPPFGEYVDSPLSVCYGKPLGGGARYDRIGQGYARFRREDPDLRARIHAALGDARTVVNVGAGAGSYEPIDREVIAVEPSAVMASQRPDGGARVLRAKAGAIPLPDRSVDAAMTVLSMHHWHPHQEAGVREMCRVARNQIVIVTIDPEVSGRMWLMADYLREVAALDDEIFPHPETVAGWLDRPATVEVVTVSRDTPDWALVSFWAHPERVLEEGARNATSGFARQSPAVVDRVVADVARDLQSGAWDERHGALRNLTEYDAGLRIIKAG